VGKSSPDRCVNFVVGTVADVVSFTGMFSVSQMPND
jgi:hypothetical protein